jgi:hypothetical protein
VDILSGLMLCLSLMMDGVPPPLALSDGAAQGAPTEIADDVPEQAEADETEADETEAHEMEGRDEGAHGWVRLGANLPYLYDPGVTLSLPWAFAGHGLGWLGDGRTGRGTLYVSPQIGVAGRPGTYHSFTVGVDAGYRFLTARRGLFHEFAVSQRYQARSEIVRINIDLGSGEQTPETELWNVWIPGLRYTFGRSGRRRTGWYIGGMIARFYSPQVDPRAYYEIEIGLQFSLRGRSREVTP